MMIVGYPWVEPTERPQIDSGLSAGLFRWTVVKMDVRTIDPKVA
jgi:hypothetical protein